MKGLYLNEMTLGGILPENSYLTSIPVVQYLLHGGVISFCQPITFLIGENGMGKSTLLEALAVACGFNPEGGGRNFNFCTQDTHSCLGEQLRLTRGPYRPKDGYFLRAESFYTLASNIDELENSPSFGPSLLKSYGGRSLHSQSHGESFLSLILNRFGKHGLYLLDEPESALSPTRQMTLLVRLHELAKQGSQFIIATHSPILMACPHASIYVLDEQGLTLTPYQETEHYQLTLQFLEAPERMLRYLLQKD